ncbi:ATP-binding cassette domain-containing protein [Tichowtungia aerotolerans]|uniref:ATP-binding cassette domain-containing protein n=1 Tax=Tichowtungia aerotolerans TaxID=2697043 RepID=A0A6P1ME58_9BACT|nr:ATP-binding cassette domain-containing protein [Tichowtungia aerotolerans]
MVQVIDLEKAYYLGDEEILVLKKVNLDVMRGDFMSIMGTSGSGKSTLMNIIGFLDRPTRGTYLLKGRDVTDLTDDEEAHIRNREIGFVYQNFNLLPRCSAYENVALPLFYREKSSDEHDQVMHALEIVGLADRARHKPNEMSGGQRQRVAIARALVTRPAILLADEPTGALDTRTSAEIMELFARLHQDGCTIIVVTHEPEVAEKTRRIIHIRDGKIETGSYQ